MNTDGYVVETGQVALKRINAVGYIDASACVIAEGANTGRRVVVPDVVLKKRRLANGRVVEAGQVERQRSSPESGVKTATCVARERPETNCRIERAGCEA